MRNLDVDKVGAADLVIWAVMVMEIIAVERIKRSRREEVDGSQRRQRALVVAVLAAKAESGLDPLSICGQPDSPKSFDQFANA